MSGSIRKLPLSAPQLDFWEAAQAYAVPSTNIYAAEYLDIRGPLDQQRFERALRQVIDEAETLHTVRFAEAVDGPVRIVDDTVGANWALLYRDLSGVHDAHSQALAQMRDHYSRTIELEHGPFFAYILFKLDDNRYYWYQGYAHIVVDGYSCSLLATRVAEVYSALYAGVPTPPCRFASLEALMEDERSYRDSAQYTEDRRYWLSRFADHPRTTTLAGPALLPERDSLPDMRETRYAQPGQHARIETVAKDLFKSTVPQLITALTAAYIHLQTGAHDVVLAVTAMARASSRERRTPCETANMLPLRLSVEPSNTLDELCRQANQEMTALRRHQRYRMGDLHRELVSLDNGQGVFGTEINIMSFDYDLAFATSRATSHNLAVGITDDFMVNLTNRRNGEPLRFDFDASPQYYRRADLNAHVTRFLALAQAALDAPEAPLRELDARLEAQPDWRPALAPAV
jgi:hypothetical protein